MPLTEADFKSVEHITGGNPFEERAYTINQMAEALGKTQITVKKWIREGLIPAPQYRDTSHKYLQYLVWEVEAIVIPIGDHFDVFDYFQGTHTETVHNVWRGLDLARLKYGVGHGRKKEK